MLNRNFLTQICEQDSPPTWTQEAYHSPHSKCSLCCSVLTWPGGGGSPVLAGRYPILTWFGGYPILSWPGGTPSCPGQEVPDCDLAWGVPHPAGVVPQSWPVGVDTPGQVNPPRKGPWTSHWGTPGKDMGPVEALWDGDGVPSCGQTNNTFPLYYMRGR